MKDILRLLRFIGRSGCRIETEHEKSPRLKVRAADGRLLATSSFALEDALRRGLVIVRHEKIFATAEASSFMRRALADREEAHLAQHRILEERAIVENGEIATVIANALESPLAQFRRMKDRDGGNWFPEAALAAGERLARDFGFASLQPRITQSLRPRVDYDKGGGRDDSSSMRDSVVAARMRVARAITAMGPDLAGVALDVCCFEKGLETVERERQWPARSAKLMLRTALLALDRHYNPQAAGRDDMAAMFPDRIPA